MPQLNAPESRAVYERLLHGKATPQEYVDAVKRGTKKRAVQMRRRRRLFR